MSKHNQHEEHHEEEMIEKSLKEILHLQRETLQRTERVEQVQREQTRILHNILRRLDALENPHRFTFPIKELTMALGNITAGTTGQVSAGPLLDNGVPYVTPPDSVYVFVPTLTSSDLDVIITPATTDMSGGTIPLALQFVLTVPAGELGTSVTISGSAPAPDGSLAVGTPLTIALTPLPQQFTFAISQLG